MFSLEALRELYRHMAWADARVWSTVTQIPDNTPDDRLRTLLLHIHTVQNAFLAVWTGQPVVFRAATEFPSLDELRRWANPYYARAEAFLQAVPPNQLEQPIQLPWAKQIAQRLGEEIHTPTLAETIFQVASHTTHHRAQVNTRLQELGVAPPLVDYIAWVWFGKPAPERA